MLILSEKITRPRGLQLRSLVAGTLAEMLEPGGYRMNRERELGLDRRETG